MRLTPEEIGIIKSTIEKHLGDVEIYLFGSRTRDDAKGGDIDILIVGKTQLDLGAIAHIRIDIEDTIGEQRIDILYQKKGSLTPFARLAKMEGVLL